MPNQNYIRPQLEIYQQLEATVNAVGGRMAACIVGPQYDLYRYGHEELTPTPFKTEEQVIPYVFAQDRQMDYTVDQSSVKLYADGLQASLAKLDNKVYVDEENPFVLRLKDTLWAATNGNLDPDLHGYGVQIGNLVVIKGENFERTRTVMGIVGKKLPAAVSAHTVLATSPEETASFALASEATAFTGKKDTTYLLKVTAVDDAQKQATLSVSDSASIDFASDLELTEESHTELAVGTLGVKVSFTDLDWETKKLAVGDTFSVACIASTTSANEFDGILLEAMPVPASYEKATALQSVELRTKYSGVVDQAHGIGSPYTVDGDGVHVGANLSLYVNDLGSFAPFVDGVGNLYVQFRVQVVPGEDEDVEFIDSVDTIQRLYGTIAVENDLAYACQCCLESGAYRGFYAIRTSGTDENAYLDAVRKTQTNANTYSFAVLTEDPAIYLAVAKYNESLCAPEIKKFRRTIFGVDNIGEYVAASYDTKNKQLQATFTAYTGDSNATSNTLVQISEDNEIDLTNFQYNGVATTVRRGDKIRLGITGESYVIRQVLSPKELLLSSGPQTEITTATAISLIKADTPQNNAEYVQGVAAAYNNRRGSVVWTDSGTLAGERIPNKFLAAAIAGLAGAVVPQQSLTRSEVTVIDSAVRMYTQYTRNDLDEIAKYGVLIVTQDAKGEPCYVRHNLTTDSENGVLYYEESCTRNLDNISFGVVNILERYIGKANVVQSALRRIDSDVRDLLDGFCSDSPDDLIGPSLVEYEIVSIRQDKAFKDRVIVQVRLGLPLPLNGIKFYEMAYIAEVTLQDVA